MRILVCGLGSIGMRHARNFRALGVADIAGFDPDAERRARFASEIGGAAHADLGKALASVRASDLGPDLVVVGSPNRFHMEQALAAARAGAHLLIEKPLSHSLAGIDELERIVAERRLFAHVGSNFKFHPAFIAMKRMIDAGTLGRITGAQVIAGQWLPDWHPWEDYRRMYSSRAELGGGVLLDTHELIYLPWLLGPVRRVVGLAARSGALEIDTEDVAAIALAFESGALATLQLDYIQREYRRRYHISGDAGTIEWDMRAARVTCYRAASRETEVIETPLADPNEMYLAQSRHVLDGVAGKVAPLTPVAEGARALRLAYEVKNANA